MDNIHSLLLDAVRAYKMPLAASELLSAHPPLVIAGTTGTGKDAIEQYIQKISNWRHVVTHTTRQIRPGEQNGGGYWFVSEEGMLKLINEQALIEAKYIHEHHVYGSSMAAYSRVLEEGHQPMLQIDVHGVKELLQHVANIRPFFVLPPSFETWMERLNQRGKMSYVERIKRMNSAKQEMEMAVENERYILVVNDEVARASKEIVDGITDIASQYRNRELAQRLIDHIKAY